MLATLLIILFYFIFVFLLYRWSKKQPGGLSVKEIALAYGLKAMLGMLYGYIFLTWYNGDDTWYFHNGSIDEYQKLLKSPARFIGDLNPVNAFNRHETFSKGWYYYLSDLEFWLISKPMALFNIVSGGNYYVNVMFFNFIVCWGHLWLFQLFLKEFPQQRKALFIAVFLIPTVVFWLSGIRGDGYIIFFLGLLLLHFNNWVKKGKVNSWIYILIGMAGIIILRSVLILLLIPALLSWWITVRFKKQLFQSTAIVYLSCVVLFFGSLLISSSVNFPSFVASRQLEYFGLRGNTRFHLDTLQPSVRSFAQVFPQSLNNTFLRPYPWEAKGFLQGAAAIEVLLVILLGILFIFNNYSGLKSHFRKPLILFSFLFAFSLYVFIGYTVPFPGAIIRYKIPAELLLVVVFASGINWGKKFTYK